MSRCYLLTIAVVVIFVIGGCSRPADPNSAEGRLAQGKENYTAYCASCHGDAGDGKGKAAYVLFPKPRNFLRSEFKLRSTPQGMLPTDDDLLRTVAQGIPGTGMFAFGEVLSEADRKAVIEYVKSLAPGFKNAAPITQAQLLKIPAAPEATPHLVALGKTVYQTFQCAKCHGGQGRGDGPSAPTLVDTSGDPFPAADFSRGIYKSGGRPEDLYRTFLTGMAGTPMPSFQEAITSEEQAWALVYYTLSFAPNGTAAPIAGDTGPLEAMPISDLSAMSDPESAAWAGVKPYRVYMRPLWYRNEYPLLILVRAVRLEGRLAIMVEWTDATADAEADREQNFADGVALQFALGDKLPFIAMGDPAGICEIWQWRADRQMAQQRGHSAVRADSYADMTHPKFPLPDFVSARDAGNVLADEQTASRPVHSLAAAGFGTLTANPPAAQRVYGRGVWSKGTYRVVFSVDVKVSDRARQADFAKPAVPVAFAIWDGHSGDRNGTKLVSQWIMLSPGPKAQTISERRPE